MRRHHCRLVLTALVISSTSLVTVVPVEAVIAGRVCCAPDITGRWEGKIKLPGMELGFDIDFSGNADALKGDISIPMQNARDLPLEKVSFDDGKVSFAIAGIPGNPTFNGNLSDDASEISGDFTQAGIKAAFTMKRAPHPAEGAGDALAGFDEWLESAREAWKVPGVAVAIVKDAGIAYAGAAGLRDMESGLPMTPDTLLAIGSSTKAFTCMVLATIADEGKLDWDAPVRDYMPDFDIADEEAARGMTSVDLVTHRSGMPRHDLVWYNSPLTREEIFARLKYLPSNKAPRAEFQYNNLMYLASGVLIERLTEKTWEEAVRERIFQPLGMKRSVFGPAAAQSDADHALPYREDDDVVKKINYRDIAAVGPAGSIYSSANDMAQWMRLNLEGKTPSGGTLVSDSTRTRLHSPHMHMGGPPAPPDRQTVSVGYGLGWFIDVYRGHRRVHHGGNIDGFSALVMLLPDDRTGIVILSNLDATPLPGIVARHAADRLLGLEPVDWHAKALAEAAQAKAMQKEADEKKKSVRKEGTSPAHALADYAGRYEHPGYGVVSVEHSSGGLHLTFNRITAPMEHWHYEVFNCLKNPDDPVLEDVKVMFLTGMNGEIDSLRMLMDPNVEEVVFKRLPDSNLTDPSYLGRLAGRYQLGPEQIVCELRGDSLWAVAPNQPAYELIPERNNTFALKNLNGFHLRFDLDETGAVTSATFIQPNGVFTATRIAE